MSGVTRFGNHRGLVGQPRKVPPQRVARASELAREVGFEQSSEITVGRLLVVLAAAVPEGGRILEIGTGTGVGTGWIVEGVGPRTIEVATIDIDQSLQSSVEALGWPEWVRFECGDAIELLPTLGQFDLVFADAVAGKWSGLDATIDSVRAGGILQVDDMQPSNWSDDEHKQRTGEVRASLITDPRLFAVELDCASGLVMCTRKCD
jgi:predicted O-methyltransferase YrrM